MLINVLFYYFIIFLFITFKIYEFSYFKSLKFNNLKDSLNNYILNCNELNNHIEDLKSSYLNIKKIDYGNAELIDASRYNYKRKEQLNAKGSSFIYDCSATICKNAEQQPFKYLCKYFNLKPTEETLQQFENILNNFSAAEEGKLLLNNEIEIIKNSIKNEKIRFSTDKF